MEFHRTYTLTGILDVSLMNFFSVQCFYIAVFSYFGEMVILLFLPRGYTFYEMYCKILIKINYTVFEYVSKIRLYLNICY